MEQSIDRLANPILGKEKAVNTATLSGDHQTTSIQRHNVIHDTYDQMTIDNFHGGRKIDESTVDVLYAAMARRNTSMDLQNICIALNSTMGISLMRLFCIAKTRVNY